MGVDDLSSIIPETNRNRYSTLSLVEEARNKGFIVPIVEYEREKFVDQSGKVNYQWREMHLPQRYLFGPDAIGKGGMGSVYMGTDIKIDRPVAIKTLKVADNNWDETIKEARVLARLRHTNIVEVYDAGFSKFPSNRPTSSEFFPFIVMEYVEGDNLHDTIRPSTREYDALWVGTVIGSVADAVDYLGSKNIYHNDLKPQNILITNEGTVKLTDFGIASGTGKENGFSVYYVAPERARGEDSSIESEVYSLGTIAYEMLSGEVPFKGQTPTAVLYNILNEPFPKLTSEQIDQNPLLRGMSNVQINNVNRVLSKACHKNPKERYHTAGEFSEALNHALGLL